MTTETRIVVTGLNCSGCVGTLTKKLKAIDGVADARVDLTPGGPSDLAVTHADWVGEPDIVEGVTRAGFRVVLP